MIVLKKNIIPKVSKKSAITNKANFSPSLRVHEKNLNEIHLCMGTETFPFNSHYRLPLILLNCIIGGSVSSRLFQEIREKKRLGL